MSHLARVVRSLPYHGGPSGFRAALASGGDSRIAVDRISGLSKYLCPPSPDNALACFGSCTATPVCDQGYADSLRCYDDITSAPGRHAAERHAFWEAEIRAAIAAYFGIGGLAEVVLQASGTDGVAWAASAMGDHLGGRPMTAVLPAQSETGTGVRQAAACLGFDAAHGFGRPRTSFAIDTVEVPLRRPDGSPIADDELVGGFATAAVSARNHPVIYVTHGSKTGLVAPLEVPKGAEVIVDACQARITPAAVRSYLRQGWPVIVTGSKFFQGPAFSGVVLAPPALMAARVGDVPSIGLGPLLRWVAALAGLRSASRVADIPGLLTRSVGEVEGALRQVSGVRIVPGASRAMCEATGWPSSIVTFTMERRRDAGQLSIEGLRPVYEGLARAGVLLGQPVSLGCSGGLRVAIGVRDLSDDQVGAKLDRLVSALGDAAGG
jgi:hypothetical protein